VDTQARHARKSKSKRRDGYRGHVAAEPETGLITDCKMTIAAGPGSAEAENGVAMAARTPQRTAAAPTRRSAGTHPAAPADRASQGLEVYGDTQYGSGEARAASGETTEILQRRPPRPMPDFSGLGSKDAVGPATPVAERRSFDRPRMRPGTMAGGRPAGGCRPSSCGLPGLACGGSWGAGAVQLVWRSGWRVGRGRAGGMALRNPGE
jgi:hypothetical protein